MSPSEDHRVSTTTGEDTVSPSPVAEGTAADDHDESMISSTTIQPAIPPTLFDQGQKVLARDNDGLLYIAFVRRSIYGCNQVEKLDLWTTILAQPRSSSREDDDDITDKRDERSTMTTTSTNSKPKWFYFVHYLAWKVNWDRWVAEEDLLEVTEEHLELQKRIMQEHRLLQQSFKTNKNAMMQEQNVGSKKTKRIDGGAFLKAWKPRLEAVLKDFKGETTTTTVCVDRPNKRQKTSSSSSSSTSTARQQQRQVQDELRRRQVLQHEHNLRHTQHLQPAPQRRSTTTTATTTTGGTSFLLEHALTIPFGLKRILVEEWEILSDPNFGMVLDLAHHHHHHHHSPTSAPPHSSAPSMPSIQTILQDYLQSKGVINVFGTASGQSPKAANEEQHHQPKEEDDGAASTPGNLAAIDESNLARESKNNEDHETTSPPPAAATTTGDDLDIEQRQRHHDHRERDKEWNDMAMGIAESFDQALPFRLLYPTEQSQFSVMLEQQQQQQPPSTQTKATVSLTELYGANHLVRLACQLPFLMEDWYFQEAKETKRPSRDNNNNNSQNGNNAIGKEKKDPQKSRRAEDGDSNTTGSCRSSSYQDDEMKSFVKPILAKVNDLLRFLQKHQSTYFPQRFRKKNEAELEWERTVIQKYQRRRRRPPPPPIQRRPGQIEEQEGSKPPPSPAAATDNAMTVGGDMTD